MLWFLDIPICEFKGWGQFCASLRSRLIGAALSKKSWLPPGKKEKNAKNRKGPGGDSEYENLLEFAEDQGVFPDFSCRSGICHTCQYELLKGRVDYTFEPLDSPYPGQALLCCARPGSNLVIDV
jgi:ferredoxin